MADRSGRGPVIRIVLVDDARLIHEALRAILRRTSAFAYVGAALTVDEGARQMHRERPEILICETEIAGQSSLDLCRWVRRTAPSTRVVMLSYRDDMALARTSLEMGASAYLLKTVTPDDLLQRLRDVMCGLTVLDERLAEHRPERDIDRKFGLSPREREVLAALSLGLDNRMIAQRLHITHDTVKSHVKSILRKLDARDRTHAVVISLQAAADR
jgi:DNA-binding NarL/FixJ family response regulator